MKGKTVNQLVAGRRTINIRNKTYEDLTGLGRMDETYDDVITRLIKYYKDHAEWGNDKK